jgi:ethanolamine utilization protein EutN/carbon dioxide concentrating mechanism protein CcmL
MQIGIVKGNVVSTNKAEKLLGLKLLMVKPISIETFEEKGDVFVAVDTVGAGEGEIVLIVGGSSSRQTVITENKPVDQSIIAIIDHVDLQGKRIFEKFAEEK